MQSKITNYGTFLAYQHSSVKHPSSIKTFYHSLDRLLTKDDSGIKKTDKDRLDILNEGLYRIQRLGQRFQDKRYLGEKDRTYIEKEYHHLKNKLRLAASDRKFEVPILINEKPDSLNNTTPLDFRFQKRKLNTLMKAVFAGEVPVSPLGEQQSTKHGNGEALQLKLQIPAFLFEKNQDQHKTIDEAKESFDHWLQRSKKLESHDDLQWTSDAIERTRRDIIINGESFIKNQSFDRQSIGLLIFNRK